MAGKLKPLNVEAPEAAEEAEGQAKSLKTEDLLAMVIKLQKEGSLEPQIENLINRINELQQVNGEKVHLEEVLSKKQEALRILQMHCQEKESEAQRCWSSDWPGRSVPWRGARSSCSRRVSLPRQVGRGRGVWLGLGPAPDARPPAGRLVRAKLRDVERRLRSPPEVEGARAVNDGLKAELEILGEQVQSAPEVGAGEGEAGPELPRARDEADPEPPVAAPDAP
ncbi:PREDICTED: synaptonemal complex central element protein 1-like isoform X3 [Rhinopithecus bieti]|uniref:synaptonemal complex central element protein 1-like isoform X3 n=1 Tax=Rhinopithecus bieti TaxID=61621 RepID=UPI00083BB88F|nr:PREDICTED: synaptonemal complex central element protein 1-like isoform X3 [Rhinopithecus bieti]